MVSPPLLVKPAHHGDDDDEHRHAQSTPMMEMTVMTETKVRRGRK